MKTDNIFKLYKVLNAVNPSDTMPTSGDVLIALKYNCFGFELLSNGVVDCQSS